MKRILFVGDSADVPSGLSRIGRDLATNLAKSGLSYEIAYAGYWGIGSAEMPFRQFSLGTFDHKTSLAPLYHACQAFRPDIVFTIYDPARLTSLALPHLVSPRDGEEAAAISYFKTRPFQLWGYFPIDAEGARPNGALTGVLRDTIGAFDRVLAYLPFGARVLGATLGRDIAWIPHFVDETVYTPRPGGREMLKRGTLSVAPTDRLLGVVATNQIRKDWGLVFEVLSMLPPEWRLWGHIDLTIKDWSIPALADDFGAQDRIFFSNSLDDATMASLYSGCDVTFGPGMGEGYGYPLVESLLCGTPAIHCLYGGGADLISPEDGVAPCAYRIEGSYGHRRPVLRAADVVEKILAACARETREDRRRHGLLYSRPQVWPRWKAWFQKGLK